ncbi:LysR substrate-binding domain-containing protein [Pseudomonas paraeruginosa]|uniref:LysR family transcriptional regulator n=1 Tax=Pseudomonas aeruginosa TaxID=287 RepID=A0ABD7K5Q3_PSEAI|nr:MULTISPECIES: LysR substrate-binding domain-containing protein [Pseudomonas aeruginosa group]RTR94640.1 LysR family transcriptional regulator [Pseudomonas paraeruginosa]RTS48949.1 LysR family transcriptional regulator [Pseudomonas aeruginosa]
MELAVPVPQSLDIVLLRTFLEVVDSGGFALAADNLALTPSAVSGHIKRLEQSAGVGLLSRTTRRLELTQAGETLYGYARNIVELEREARARLHGTPIRERLRIGASEDFASAWLPRVLQRFRRWHPEASIELKVGITSDLLRQQAQGRTDVVFGKQCRRVEDDGELLWEEPLVWAAASAVELSPGEPLPLALFPEPCVYREAAITALGAAARPWRLVFESASMAGCLSAALAGFAVTVVARSQMREGLREVGPEQGFPDLPEARFYAFSRQAAEALVEAVRQLGQRNRFVAARG